MKIYTHTHTCKNKYICLCMKVKSIKDDNEGSEEKKKYARIYTSL